MDSLKYVWTNHIAGFASSVISQFGAFLKDWKKLGLWKAMKESVSVATTISSGFAETLAALAGPIAIVTGLVLSLTSSYGGLSGVLERVKKVFSDTIQHVKDFADSIGFSDKIAALKDALGGLGGVFKTIYEWLGLLKPIWEVFFTTITGIATTALNMIVGAINGFVEIVTGIINVFVGLVTLDFTTM